MTTETVSPTCGNLIACEAITTRLTQVAEIAESLDFTLKNVQTCFEIDVSDISFDDRSLERLEMGTTIGSSDVSKIHSSYIYFKITYRRALSSYKVHFTLQ